jgi:Tol biopolymer transport system component
MKISRSFALLWVVLSLAGCARDILFARAGQIRMLACDDDRLVALPTSDNEAPLWSPDGQAFAYLGRDALGPAIFVADRLGRGARNVTSGDVATPTIDFVWSLDGQFVVYTATNSTGTQSIYRVRVDPPGSPQPLTPLSLNSKHPSVSPDGRRFVYASTSPNDPDGFDLYTNNIDGMNRTLLHATPGLDDLFPVWGPDGRIVYSRGADLYLIDADGTHDRVGGALATLAGVAAGRLDKPAWSPSGDYIVYSGASEKVYLIDSRPPYSPRCLTCPAGPGLNLDWTPRWMGNDDRIVFHRPIRHIPPVDAPEGLHLVTRDGSEETYLAEDGMSLRPDPRPRGRRLCLGS